jgi:hypothetical protein
MKVILIHSLLPETTEAYLIINPTKEQIKLLETVHNVVFNVNGTTEEQEDAYDKLSAALAARPAEMLFNTLNESIKPWAGIFADGIINIADINKYAPFDKIYLTGFLL